MEEDEEDKNALEFLQGIYKNPMVALPVRIRAAIEALPFETSKLSAVGVGHMNADTCAERLERALQRSNGARLIEAKAIEVKD